MPQNFLLCIGDCYYTPASFAAEAERLGVSRRIHHIPETLVPGESRIYLIFGAGHDSYPRKCKQLGCAENDVALTRFSEDDATQVFCPDCGHIYEPRKRASGKITSYFSPTAIDIVVNITEDVARTAAHGAHELGQLSMATLEDDGERLRLMANVKDGASLELLKLLAERSGSTAKVDLLASAFAHQSARVVGVVHEPKRGCGFRKLGTYLVAGQAGISPLIDVAPPVSYDGPHFRGLKKLSDSESMLLERHLAGLGTAVIGNDACTPTFEECDA